MAPHNWYGDGYFDHATRDFYGFGYTAQIPPSNIVTESWFHQDEHRKGKQYRTDVFEPEDASGNSAQISSTTMTWETEPVGTNETSTFVKLSQKYTEYYDDQTTFSQEDFTYDSTNGDMTFSTSSGTNAETMSTESYYENFDANSWMNRLLWTKVFDSQNNLVRQTNRNYYTEDTYENGLLIGKKGNLKEEIAWWDQNDNFVGDLIGDPTVSYTYDEYGNTKTVKDAKGHITTTEYDTETFTFPVKITYPTTNGVAHVTEKGCITKGTLF